jgi:linoleoyl-CoA desaturase
MAVRRATAGLSPRANRKPQFNQTCFNVAQIAFKTGENPFFTTLRNRVDAYFDENNIERTGNARIVVKTVVLFSAAIALYTWLVFFTPATWLALSLCVVMGGLFAAIGFNVMHDGAHGAYSKYKWVNEIMGYSLNLLGGDVQLWKVKHNMIHHSFTNVEGLDEDIDIQPFLRTNLNQKRYGIHRFQHVYCAFLYSLTYLSWIYLDDFRKYFTGRIGATRFRKFRTHQHLIFWATKLFNIFLFIVLPISQVGLVGTLAGYFTAAMSCGLLIAVVFQLAHVVEETTFSSAFLDNKNVEDEWAVHQIRSTANFATENKVVSWFTGGLNFQVEHHLFPRISHVYYPEISKMVEQTCREFGIPYLRHQTVYAAVRSHVMHLKEMGRGN